MLDKYESVKFLSLCAEALWPENTSVVNYTHSIMAIVPWNFNMLVFNDVLLNDCFSQFGAIGLLDSLFIYLSVWNESTIPWDVFCNLLGSNWHFVMHIIKFGWSRWQIFSGDVSEFANGLSKLSFISSSWAAVTYAVDTPSRSCRSQSWSARCFCCLLPVGSIPVLSCCVEVPGDGRSITLEQHSPSFSEWIMACSRSHSSEFSWVKQLWMVWKFITD